MTVIVYSKPPTNDTGNCLVPHPLAVGGASAPPVL